MLPCRGVFLLYKTRDGVIEGDVGRVDIFFLSVFFFKQKTAYEITVWEFRRVLFRSVPVNHY